MKIEFDKYSLKCNDKSFFVRSAALHYFRLPGVELWRDRLLKLKAAGYNTVDLYFCWGYHSPEEGVYDFSEEKDVRILLNIIQELGLKFIARPGPFINAEISAGGLPLWLLNKENVIPRNRKDGDFVYSKEYMKYLRDWYRKIVPMINEKDNLIAFQIENEYSTNAAEPEYMQELYDLVRDLGVKVPIFHNDAYAACLYSDVVDIYASDIYPFIDPKQDWKADNFCFDTLDNMEENIRICKEDAPLFIAEMQAGWFDKWGGKGHDFIREKLGREHINIMTKTAISQGLTMFNHYMGCGGTSWGNLACDEVYTSYDFAAPISEEGLLGENYYKAKEINYFLNSFGLERTDNIEDDDLSMSDVPANIFTKLRQDNINGCKWFFVRNFNEEEICLNLKNKENIIIEPFDMKVLPVDLALKTCKIDFSSCSLLGKIEKENKEKLFVIAEKDCYIKLSEFEKFECSDEITVSKLDNVLKISLDDLNEDIFAFCKLEKAGKETEIIFLGQKMVDKTWLFENKALIGPDILSDKPYIENTSKIAVVDFDHPVEFKEVQVEKDNQDDIPKLIGWSVFNCALEIEGNENSIKWKPCQEKMDSLSNGLYDEFVWYKGVFDGNFESLKINAKHCFALYLNGRQIYEHDSYCYEELTETEEVLTVNFQGENFKEKNNELVILVQNLGFDKGFSNDTNVPRGVVALETFPQKDISWKVKDGLDIEQNGFNSSNEPSNSSLQLLKASFDFNCGSNDYAPLFVSFEDSPIDRAVVYLKGKKIARYWEEKGPQQQFYLPESFLNSSNELFIVAWNKNRKDQQMNDYKSLLNNVNIKIGSFKSYKALNEKDLTC